MVVLWVNTHFMLVSDVPHGGQKLSGYGKDMSLYGLEDYTVVRHVMLLNIKLNVSGCYRAATIVLGSECNGD